jgi:cyclopropane-fatty-acyl-phospholipid synthase
MLLTNNVFKQQSAKMGLNLANSFEFGESYAQTCQLWREKFNKVTQEVRVLGFDEKFIRLWNLYLGYCEGAFRAGRINVGQFLLKS